jgi:hypothetical protein
MPATLVTSFAKCRDRGPYYKDKYNCVIRFAAIAQKGQFFPITAKGYNSPAIVVPYRSPPFDDLPPVVEDTKSITTAPCGALGKECCPAGFDRCDDDTMGCDNNICRACGATNNVCCPGNKCQDGVNAACVNEGVAMRCRECGQRGEACCNRGGKLVCNVGQGPCLSGICDIVPPADCNKGLGAVTLTGPLTDVPSPPHYADGNGSPQAGCAVDGALDGTFGKIGLGLITWTPPADGNPQRYLLTFHPGGETQYVTGGANALIMSFHPVENPCGVIGVTIQSTDGCGHFSPIGPTSGMYVKWQ